MFVALGVPLGLSLVDGIITDFAFVWTSAQTSSLLLSPDSTAFVVNLSWMVIKTPPFLFLSLR